MQITYQNQTFQPQSISEHPDLEKQFSELGIELATWEVDTSTFSFPPKTNTEKQALIQHIAFDLNELKARRKYLTEDIVALTSETPNLQNILKPFETPHYHTDDEVRTTLDGQGIFTIYFDQSNLSDKADILLEKNDLLVVPAYCMHSFHLTEKQYIVALRVFGENPKWEAHYEWATRVNR